MSLSNVHNGYAEGLSWEEAMSFLMQKHEEMYAADEEAEEPVISSEDGEDTDEASSSEDSSDETEEEDSKDETGEESEDDSEGESNVDNRRNDQMNSSERNDSERTVAVVSQNPRNGRYQSRTYVGTDRQYRIPHISQSAPRRQSLTVNEKGVGRRQVNDVPLDDDNVQPRAGLLYEQAPPPTHTHARLHFEGHSSLSRPHGSSLPHPVYGTRAWHGPIRQAQILRDLSSVPSPATGTIQQATSSPSLAPRGPQIQHKHSTLRVPLRQTPSYLDHDQALRTHEVGVSQRQKRLRTVEDTARNKAKPIAMTSTNGQEIGLHPIPQAISVSQSPDSVQKTVSSPIPTMSRAQALSPWSQHPPWPPGYVLAESLRKPSPSARYDLPLHYDDSEQLPGETLDASRKRSLGTMEEQADTQDSKRRRVDVHGPSSGIPSISLGDGGNTSRYVGQQYHTGGRWPRNFNGELMSERELRGHIAGYPPRDQPMPEGLSVDEKVRYWPNHLHGQLLLEITDGDWGLKPTEIARMFNGNRHENLLKPNTLVKRILKLKEARDAGKEIL